MTTGHDRSETHSGRFDVPDEGVPLSTIPLIARFTARRDTVALVSALLADFARTVRQEDGNITFVPYSLDGLAEAFFVYEVYRDRAAIDAHAASAHTAWFTDQLVPLIVEDSPVLTFLDELPLG